MQLFILIIQLLLITGITSDDWKLIKETDEFKVYVRKPADTKYEQIKIVATTNSSLSEVVSALEDVDHHKDWNYGMGECYVINNRNPDDFDYYITLDMPFPVRDRDVVINYKRKQDETTRIVQINSKSNSALKDIQDKYIRITKFESEYILTPTADGTVKIEYFMHADPAGNLPAWVVNLVTTKGPTETMKSLLALLKSGHYTHNSIVGIID